MTKPQLLLVDGDPRTLHVLEASLRSVGFAVMTAGNGQAALARCRVSPPDVVVSDTAIPGLDGFQLCEAIKSDETLKDTPIVFLSGHDSVEEKVRGFELGAEDYLTKPIDTREFVTRMRVLVEKREKERRSRREQRDSFAASLSDLSIADLLQTLEIGRKSGTAWLEAEDGRVATLWLHEGAVVDAATGWRRGEAAFHWLLKWRDGRFSMQFGPVARPARITSPTQHLLLDGMRRLDEWSRVMTHLPATASVLQIDYLLLSERLADIPDAANAVLKLVDGRRTITQILEDCDLEELQAVNALHMVVREEIVRVRPNREAPPAPPRVPIAMPPSILVGARTPGNWAQAAQLGDLPARREVPSHGTVGTARGGPSLTTAIAAAARDAPREDDPPSRRAAVGLLVLLIAVAVGFAARQLVLDPAPARVRARTPVVRGEDGAAYETALAEARREQLSARFAEAAIAYRRAVGARATSEAYEGLGRALRDTGDTPAAIDALRRAIELDPGNAAAYIAVARIHVESRRVDEARSAYRDYLALEPKGSHAEEARTALGGAP